MVDDSKLGTDWQADELDAIVADYFAMLDAELAGHAYVKTRHRETLMAQIGRTHGSVEFKHQNISAVLDELGLPWIPEIEMESSWEESRIFSILLVWMSPGIWR